ncbi:MAG: bifunctional demethylmenaquinone methyltransferase/2-methoxy-6-polyprenyl-1,4-benzoquinol methylase UbiE [Myxococcales bacterium]|nr:bifunctional demethylmenaquinone methyltransferase/2-methoxy-6-polyprenyl-1,4-benzoquinol methylase UbiE [Myxococcales bacterium]
MSDPQTQTNRALAPRGGSGEMFDRIAGRYDLLNRIISLGIDQGWRRRTVRSLGLASHESPRVLDLATGTADLAIMIAEMLPRANVVGVDPSRGMLAVGDEKIARAKLNARVSLQFGEAERLPLEDRSVDGITMAFGIRNVADRPAALREMARVTRPGGKVAILELSDPKPGPLSAMARFHIHTVVPWLGSILSGSREYRYLHESIAAFPSAERFAALMGESGLDVVEVAPLTFGVVHLYVGTPKA